MRSKVPELQNLSEPHGSANIGLLFRDLRRCLRLSIPELARKLETRIEIVEALERGDFSGIPSWPETVRVVSVFTMLADIDPRPVLQAIATELANHPPISAMTKVPVGSQKQPNVRLPAPNAIPGGWHLGRWSNASFRQVMRVLERIPLPQAARHPLQSARSTKRSTRLALVCAVLAALITSIFQSPMLQASVTEGTIGRVVSSLHEYVLKHTSQKKDGMVWIDVSDPRSRRTDKLPVEQQ